MSYSGRRGSTSWFANAYEVVDLILARVPSCNRGYLIRSKTVLPTSVCILNCSSLSTALRATKLDMGFERRAAFNQFYKCSCSPCSAVFSLVPTFLGLSRSGTPLYELPIEVSTLRLNCTFQHYINWLSCSISNIGSDYLSLV